MVNNAEKSADSYKGRMAQKYGIPFVSTRFVDVSVERGGLVESDDFLAVGKTAAEQFQTGKIIGNICMHVLCVCVCVCVCACACACVWVCVGGWVCMHACVCYSTYQLPSV